MCVFSALFFCGQPHTKFSMIADHYWALPFSWLTLRMRRKPLLWFRWACFQRQDTFQWLHRAGEMHHMWTATFTICLQILADAVVWSLPFLLAFPESKPVQTYCRKKWITSYSTAQGFCWPRLMTFFHVRFEHRWFLLGSLWMLAYATFKRIECSCVFARQCAELAVCFFPTFKHETLFGGMYLVDFEAEGGKKMLERKMQICAVTIILSVLCPASRSSKIHLAQGTLITL